MLPILVINLDKDADRLARMDRELTNVGLTYQRLPAVRGADLPAAMRPYFRLVDGASPTLTPGELGCYASHLTAFEMVGRNNWPGVVVMEDDLHITDALPAALRAFEQLPSDWDIVRIATLGVKTAVVPVSEILPGMDLVKYWRVPLGCGAYAVSRKGARKFLAWARRRPLWRPIDVDLARDWECGMTTYGVAPVPARQDFVVASTIDRDGGARPRRSGLERTLEPIARAAHNWGRLGPGPFLTSSAANIRARLSRSYRRQLSARVGA